ncbi:integral membrane protein [Pseudohyphozyma bogoriensis]|nr:integral membrane protein [Pseudohyphozyma bogoriensis]
MPNSVGRALPLHTPHAWELVDSHGHLPASFEPNRETYFDRDSGVHFLWSSRNHRKGIPPKPVDGHTANKESEGDLESAKGEAQGGGKPSVKRQRMRFVGFDFWDIIIFVVGSIFWCINAILFFCYFTNTTLPYTNTEAATAFIGGTTFLIGAYLGWVESLNPAHDADFGWEFEKLTQTFIEPSSHGHRLGRRRRHFGKHYASHHASPPSSKSTKENISPQDTVTESLANGNAAAPSISGATLTSAHSPTPPAAPPKWRWYGTSRSLAYIANTIQLFGASIFFISTLCGLPGVLPLAGGSGGPEQGARTEGLWVGLYWACQVIGAPCFVIAGAMFCLEVQKKWYIPNPMSIGWQIGFWNLIGGFGFWFCGIFGIWRQTSLSDPNLYQKWGTAFSTFWGSWAFLIGSYIQLWEGINKRA